MNIIFFIITFILITGTLYQFSQHFSSKKIMKNFQGMYDYFEKIQNLEIEDIDLLELKKYLDQNINFYLENSKYTSRINFENYEENTTDFYILTYDFFKLNYEKILNHLIRINTDNMRNVARYKKMSIETLRTNPFSIMSSGLEAVIKFVFSPFNIVISPIIRIVIKFTAFILTIPFIGKIIEFIMSKFIN